MKIKEFVNYAKENNIRLTTSEELELKEINEYYEDLRKLGFYRVFETYYIDEYQCHQFYGTAFINSENGYEYLLSTDDDIDSDGLDKVQYELYVVLNESSKWDRKEKLLLKGTLKEILEYTKELDKQENSDYYRWKGNK